MKRVALAAGPGAPRVDEAVAGYLSRDVGYGLVVAQGVEVVLEEAARLLVVDPAQRCRLAEVRGVDGDPHPKQPRQLLLVPPHGFGVAQVYYRIIYRRFAVGAKDGVALLGVFEARRRELEVAAVGHLGPAGVDVDNV